MQVLSHLNIGAESSRCENWVVSMQAVERFMRVVDRLDADGGDLMWTVDRLDVN